MGILFRDKHSYRDMKVRTQIQDRPISAPKKTNFVEDVPYRDGSIDFTEAGGRAYYQDKILEIDFFLIDVNARERNRSIERFVSWINGGVSELIIDDMPTTKWIATPVTVEDMATELARIGKTTVEFRCEPYNRFLYDTNGIPIGSDIELGSEILLGWGEDFVKAVNGTSSFTITNEGTVYVRPDVRISGSFRSFSITLGSNTLTYNQPFTNLVLDCAKFTAFSGDVNVTENTAGDFFELAPGDNEISIRCDGSGEIAFIFTPGYFYEELMTGGCL